MNRSWGIVLFVVGLALGILGTIFLPTYVRPYVPQWIAGKTVIVTGTVAAKQKKEKVLLLTVNTPEGSLLATFKKKVDEINLLISEKDRIEFTLPKYLPFIDDPRIIRVVKDQQAAPAPEPAPVELPKENNAKEGKSGRHETVRGAAPATGATVTTPPDRK